MSNSFKSELFSENILIKFFHIFIQKRSLTSNAVWIFFVSFRLLIQVVDIYRCRIGLKGTELFKFPLGPSVWFELEELVLNSFMTVMKELS